MLKVDRLDVYYKETKALHNVSIDVNQGELVTLIGANGAGKTTLLMSISGLLKPALGTIEFQGQRIDLLRTHEIVCLGISQVPQGVQLFPAMTVWENLILGSYRNKGKNRKEIINRIYFYFEILNKRKNQKAGTLSGGERQMLGIARGLMANPKLLILDEPSVGLAPLMVQHLVDIIVKLNEGGLTILLAEQNAYLALDIANRCYVLETGSIALSGSKSDLLKSELVKSAYLGM